MAIPILLRRLIAGGNIFILGIRKERFVNITEKVGNVASGEFLQVLVYRATDLALVASFKVMLGTASTTSIKSIEFSRRGEWLLINTADRVIRVYDSMEVVANGKDGETEPVQVCIYQE